MTADAGEVRRASARWHWSHLATLLAVLLVVEAPRLIGLVSARSPVVPSARGYVDFDHGYYPAAQRILHDPSQLYRESSFDERTGVLHVNAPVLTIRAESPGSAALDP